MEGVKITERGWAGHFICAHYCLFRRNTLIEYANKKIVVSTVGRMIIRNPDTGESEIETIGLNRWYETMAFVGKNEGGYIDADVSKPVVFESEWGIFGETWQEVKAKYNLPDNAANKMHDDVVKELMITIKK